MRQGGVKLRVVEFVIAECGKKLEWTIARQFALINIAAAAVGKVLANDQTVDDCQAEQGGKRFHGWAQGQGWGGKAGAECAAQEQSEHAGQNRQQAQQSIEGVGLDDVVDYFLGIDKVIHRNEVEAHAEFIPEQPFGSGDEQHQEQQQGKQHRQGVPMPASLPPAAGAEQEIKGQRQHGVGEKGEIVGRPQQKQLRRRQWSGRSFLQMSQPEQAAGTEKNAQPAGDKQGEVARLRVARQKQGSCTDDVWTLHDGHEG